MQKATTTAGLVWCLVFLVLDAVQAVWFGALLQRHDSFQIGFLVFGSVTVGSLAWVALRYPEQLAIARAHPGGLLGLNLTAVGAWMAYFAAIQRIEPAIAFMLFSGFIPATTIVAAWLGYPEGQRSRNGIEFFGNALLVAGMALLCLFTLADMSGFVRGGAGTALTGLGLAIIAGILIALMLLFSQRLDRHGLLPAAQLGLRFPLYLVLALIGWLAGFDFKGAVSMGDLLLAVGIGLVLLAFPIYAVQKAVSLASSLTIAAIAATAPVLVFALQAVEGRVELSVATSLGLAVCFSGAMLAVYGTARALEQQS